MARDPSASPPVVLPAWPLLVVAVLVVFRAAAIGFAFALGQWSSNRAFPAWISLLQIGIFLGPALLLLLSGRRDRRAWPLGVYFLDVACTIAEPYVRRWADPLALTTFALGIRTDAFQGAMLWFFASEFPRRSARTALSRAYLGGYLLALLTGVVLCVVNAFPTGVSDIFGRRWAGWYFGVQYLTVPLLALAFRRQTRDMETGDRRRARLLVAAIGASVGSVMFVVLLRGAFGFQLNMVSAGAWTVLFTIGIGALPLVATYAALVQRVLPISVLLRAAAQYVLSQYIVYALAVIPFAAAVIYLFSNRLRTVADVFAGLSGLVLIGSGVTGLLLMVARGRLLDAVDRQFGRRALQASGPLMDLVAVLRSAKSIEEFASVTTNAITVCFGPRTTSIAIADGRGLLHSQNDSSSPLPQAGALAQLLGGSDEPLAVSVEAGTLLSRLNEAERTWLAQSQATLIAPMRGPDGALVGLILLTDRTSELPYSEQDRRSLAAFGSTCGLALYNLRVRDLEGGSDRESSDSPARECVECGRLHPGDAIACQCGAPLQRAPVPFNYRNHLRFMRRVGAGAMGVVYEARDLEVHQSRAVKALPETDPALMGRLRREARTMAGVSHSNLATFFALESWKSAPLLVMEFCGGGTLADRLKRGPLPIDQALRVCEQVADALDHLHRRGIVHRDVKPSNIGFTAESVPKLLDFGLAKLMEGAPQLTLTHDSSTYTAPLTDSEGAIRGTPAYLSPEVLSGLAPSPRDDVWSLSVTLLEACSGVNPFRASTPAATAARVMVEDGRVAAAVAPLPAVIGQLIRELLEPRPDRRPSSAIEFQRRIRVVTLGGNNEQNETISRQGI